MLTCRATRWKNRATAPQNFPAADLFPTVKRPMNARALSGLAHCTFLTPVFPQFFGGSPFVLLTLLLLVSDTEYRMARYSAFLGRRVEVQYRAGDILLPASGTFVADS